VSYDSDLTDRILFGEKKCPTCGETKPRNHEHYNYDESEPGGLHRECRACRGRQRRETRAAV